MIDLGLTRAEQRAYDLGLAKSRHLRVRVRILNGDEEEIASLTADDDHVLDGAVDVDWTAAISRQARLTLLDHRGTLDLDPHSPAGDSLWVDKFLTIERLDWIDALDGDVACPVFWGPLAHYERSGDQVELEALGKEALALHPNVLWKSLNFRKGVRLTYVIRKLLAEQGETRFSIPDGIERKLPKRLSVGKMAEPWTRVQRLCGTLDRQGFYDGKGRFRVRQEPERPAFTFRRTPSDDVPAMLVADPTYSFDFERVRNVVEVLGKDPKGKTKRVRAVAVADRDHPLSPWSLARNGQPRFMVERIERDKLGKKGCQALADRRLRQLLRSELEISGESLPVPHAEELDVALVVAGGRRVEVPLKQFTIPLVADDTMSLGFTKRQKYRPKKKGKKRRRG